MNLELGKYAGDVLMAYGFGLLALAVLVGFYVSRNARVRRALLNAETRKT